MKLLYTLYFNLLNHEGWLAVTLYTLKKYGHLAIRIDKKTAGETKGFCIIEHALTPRFITEGMCLLKVILY